MFLWVWALQFEEMATQTIGVLFFLRKCPYERNGYCYLKTWLNGFGYCSLRKWLFIYTCMDLSIAIWWSNDGIWHNDDGVMIFTGHHRTVSLGWPWWCNEMFEMLGPDGDFSGHLWRIRTIARGFTHHFDISTGMVTQHRWMVGIPPESYEVYNSYNTSYGWV